MAVLFMTLFVNRTGDESKFYKEGAHKTQLLNYDETFSSESETKLFDCIKIRWSPPDGPTLPRWSRQPPSSLSLPPSLSLSLSLSMHVTLFSVLSILYGSGANIAVPSYVCLLTYASRKMRLQYSSYEGRRAFVCSSWQ